MLKMNIDKNGCANIISLGIGVTEEPGNKEIAFWDRRYSFMADTPENILVRVQKIHFKDACAPACST